MITADPPGGRALSPMTMRSDDSVEVLPSSRFELEDDRIARSLTVGEFSLRSSLPLSVGGGSDSGGERRGLAPIHSPASGGATGVDAADACEDPLGAWWKACLRGSTPVAEPPLSYRPKPIRVVDLFAGAGGLMVGVRQLAAEAGHRVVCELAVDTDADALAVHARNHRTRMLSEESVTSLVDYRTVGAGSAAEFVYPPTLIHERMSRACAGVDLVVAGPPCQGHSNLNNHSRRNDRRNFLYLAVPAFAAACGARSVVIENVTSVVHDEARVVQTARLLLESNGYAITEGVLAADAMGWPQTRKRHFLIARRTDGSDTASDAASRLVDGPRPGAPVPIDDVQAALRDARPRSVLWAIGDNQRLSHDQALHRATELTAANRQRLQWLFDNDEHDLILSERPDCHKDGTSYRSVYGRMHADQPAPTITTGYTTPGRGRFVHPTQQRTLTPAEAARLQGFPDGYHFNPAPDRPARRTQLAKWIGDAVAAPLGYAAAFSALAPQIARTAP